MSYVLRFLLGACEAGSFPRVLHLLTVWMPFGHRARMVGWFMIASVVANAVGAPICGSLLDLDGTLGLHGWQRVFLTTSVPAVLMGAVTWLVLPDGPETASFLNPAQRTWLRDTIAREDQAGGKVAHANSLKALGDGRVLLLAFTFVGFPLAAYSLSYWLPTVVKGFGVSNTTNGFINVLPWLVTGVALWWLPRHSERTGEKTWHIALPVALGAACLVGSAMVTARLPETTRCGSRCCAWRRRASFPPSRSSDPAEQFPARQQRGGGADGHQRDRQPRRLRGAERGAVSQAAHRERPDADAVPGGVPGVRRADGLCHAGLAGAHVPGGGGGGIGKGRVHG